MALNNSVTRFLNDLDASTTEKEIDELTEAQDIMTPTWDLLYDKRDTQDGGQFLTQPLEYDKSPGGFLSPFGTMRTEHKEQYTKAIYEWCVAYTTAGIAQKDLYLNSGGSRVFDLALEKRASAKKSLINLMAYNVFSDHSESLNAQNQIDLSNVKGYLQGQYDIDGDRMEGLPFAIDDDSNYGRIDYSGNEWWQSQVIDSNNESPANTFTLALNQKMLSLCGRGAVKVTYCPMGRQYWDRFQNLIGPQQNLDDPTMADLGYDAIKKGGCVYYLEPMADDSGTGDDLFYFNPTRFQFMTHPEVDFMWTGWKEGYDQLRSSWKEISSTKLGLHRWNLNSDEYGNTEGYNSPVETVMMGNANNIMLSITRQAPNWDEDIVRAFEKSREQHAMGSSGILYPTREFYSPKSLEPRHCRKSKCLN